MPNFRITYIRFLRFSSNEIALTSIPPPALEMTLSVVISMTYDPLRRLRFSIQNQIVVFFSCFKSTLFQENMRICVYTLYTGESNVTHCAANPAGDFLGGGVIPIVLLYIYATMTSH